MLILNRVCVQCWNILNGKLFLHIRHQYVLLCMLECVLVSFFTYSASRCRAYMLNYGIIMYRCCKHVGHVKCVHITFVAIWVILKRRRQKM